MIATETNATITKPAPRARRKPAERKPAPLPFPPYKHDPELVRQVAARFGELRGKIVVYDWKDILKIRK